MSSCKVLVTRRLPERGMAMIREKCDTVLWDEDRPIPFDRLCEMAAGVDGIVCLLSDTIDKAVMDAAGPGLKAVSVMAVGYDKVDVNEATRRGILVGNTPGVLTEATADLAWALILSLGRRIVEGDVIMRKGGWTGWSPTQLLGADFNGRTIGIVGMGRIGSAVARRAKGFGMKVLYYNRNPLAPEKEKELDAKYVLLNELMERSDFVSLHCPLNDASYQLIGEAEIFRMKKTAYLVNVARGPVVDEAALVNALKEKKIAGAAFDVYEKEPELSPGLIELDNVVLAPHLGSASIETRDRMSEMCAQNLLAALGGEVPPWCVNPEAKKTG